MIWANSWVENDVKFNRYAAALKVIPLPCLSSRFGDGPLENLKGVVGGGGGRL